MTKPLWIKLDGSWEEIKPLLTSSIESGIGNFVLNGENAKKAKRLARGIKVASFGSGGDIEILRVKKEEDVNSLKENSLAFVEIDSKEKEDLALSASKRAAYVLVSAPDWKVIPLENLIAKNKGAKLLALIEKPEEIELGLGILEKGIDGVVLLAKETGDIKKAKEVLARFSAPAIDIRLGKITRIQSLGLGDRVCIDTIAILREGEGMLVGSQSNGFFLVHGETLKNPYVEPRPFRVNAGAVHSYIMAEKNKTKYLSEVKAGDRILISNGKGATRTEYVGRVKIERRPMLLIEAITSGGVISIILQNAETVNLLSKEKKPVSVSRLKEGDEVLVHLEEGGRHFGIKVKESLIER